MLARKFSEMLEPAGITINGGNPWDIHVHDRRWYGRILRDRNLGLGESYMDGWWDCGRLDEMFHRLLRSGLDDRIKGGLLYLGRLLPGSLINRQSRRRSRMVAEQHYDLGNDLFLSFLDSHQQYSCGFFQDTDDLDRAQERKLQLIVDKLALSADDHLLDIGCGWGGLARYAARHYGCTVTAVNISKEQLQHARRNCEGLPVRFRDCDYRSLSGQFDKVVSVGMFEHVGHRNYRTFMQVVSRCLKDDGIFLLHSIVGNTSKTCCDPWINKYIFPNGVLPGMRQIARATDQLFVVEDVHNLGPHYDKTLMAWNDRFQQTWQNLKDRYDMRFKRMWEYYLLSCAGAFRARKIQLWQIVMTKFGFGRHQPDRRP